MTLKILRMDKQEEPRANNIAQNWRQWVITNGYLQKDIIPLEQGYMHIQLETWEHPSIQKDRYLFYHPEIPGTNDTEILYIINDREMLERIVAISQHMATDLMRRIQILNKMHAADTAKPRIPVNPPDKSKEQWN